MTLFLRHATLIDGLGSDPLEDASVTVEEARIQSVQSGRTTAPASAKVLDLDGLTLLPGLIDAHTHLGILSAAEASVFSPAMTAALLFQNAELCLLSGHTTAREMGGADGALRQVIDSGLVPGPRLYPSGPLLCQTGGHGDLGPPFYPHHPGVRGTPGLADLSISCDGPDGVRIAARQAFRRGATQLKMCISGGVISHTDRLEDTQFSKAELAAAVDEARARGTYVTAHAHNVEAINLGLDAGVACFEHGSFLDEETANRMAREGAALVPTLTVTRLLASEWAAWGVPEAVVPRLQGVEEAMLASVKLAHDAGVAVGSGTDLLGPRQNHRGLEIALKSRVMGPMAAIVSATSTNARILGSKELGVIAPDKLADLIVVSGDPLAEPELFDDPERVVLIVKGGVIVKDSRS